jgi:hypothetical protein
MTAKSDAKQRKAEERRQQRLAESKNLYYREVLDGGCVVLQSKYWEVMAKRPRPKESAKVVTEQSPVDAVGPALNDLHQRWLAMLLHVARKSGFKDGWAAYQFRDKFGVMPPYELHVEPIAPSAEVKQWMKERRAVWAKEKAYLEQAHSV